MEKTRMGLADSLEEDFECSAWVIQRIRVIEKQYDDLFKLAEESRGCVCGSPYACRHDLLAEFLAEQKRRFSDRTEGQIGTSKPIYVDAPSWLYRDAAEIDKVLDEPILDTDYSNKED